MPSSLYSAPCTTCTKYKRTISSAASTIKNPPRNRARTTTFGFMRRLYPVFGHRTGHTHIAGTIDVCGVLYRNRRKSDRDRRLRCDRLCKREILPFKRADRRFDRTGSRHRFLTRHDIDDRRRYKIEIAESENDEQRDECSRKMTRSAGYSTASATRGFCAAARFKCP